ncbi:hypothetical protein [Massilia timonae]|uniref:Uncharacterized protein n=1 Tax=Massilia timonae TaxID=47229 RepID=A0A1S2ND44_9BURK|nr:hypothetical protein [Massilia timonae]OIJ42312.1 hypothetical protein LO55_5071 [Massilia timonae]
MTTTPSPELPDLDRGYFKGKLAIIVRDLSHYTAPEMARELVRLAKAADESEAVKEARRAQPEGEAPQAAPLRADHRATIEEAAQVLESAAAHNRFKGRTVLEHQQQDRADRLRAILSVQHATPSTASRDAHQLASLILQDPDGGRMVISSPLESGADGAMWFTATNPETRASARITISIEHDYDPATAQHAEIGAPAPNAERVDAIVTGLYRRFKDWSKRGFGPDDVTWCEVKADVIALIATGAAESGAQAGELPPLPQGVELGWSTRNVRIMGYTYSMMQDYARQALAAQSQGAQALPAARAGDPDLDAARWAEVFYRNAETFTVRDLGIVRAAWKEATRRASLAAKAEAPAEDVLGQQRWSKEAEMLESWSKPAAQQAAAPGAPTDQERADFEYWYVTHIDGAEIGSADCAARWSTWLARSGGFYKAPSDWLIAPMPWAAPAADIVAEFGAAPGALPDRWSWSKRGMELDPNGYYVAYSAPGTPEAPSDTERMDWLDQNIFHRGMDDLDAMRRKETWMWVTFAPKGVQGTARSIIDAARAAQIDGGQGEGK